MIKVSDIEQKTMTEAKRKEAKNSIFAFYIGRPLSYLLTIPFLYLGTAPNTVTLLSIICSIIGFAFLGFGNTVQLRLVGLLFFFLWNMGDGIDGNIARYKNLKSANGDLLDTLGGYLATVLILLAMGGAAANDGPSLSFITAQSIALLSGVSAVSTIIPRLLMHRKDAMNKDSSKPNALKDKANYSFAKIVALNICDPAGFQEVIALIAIILHLCTEFTLVYLVINTAIMIYSILKLME